MDLLGLASSQAYDPGTVVPKPFRFGVADEDGGEDKVVEDGGKVPDSDEDEFQPSEIELEVEATETVAVGVSEPQAKRAKTAGGSGNLPGKIRLEDRLPCSFWCGC